MYLWVFVDGYNPLIQTEMGLGQRYCGVLVVQGTKMLHPTMPCVYFYTDAAIGEQSINLTYVWIVLM